MIYNQTFLSQSRLQSFSNHSQFFILFPISSLIAIILSTLEDQIKMKKSSKYKLLSKDQPIKEKEQSEWIEMESVNKWEERRNMNSNTSYMKFQDEPSEIDYDHVTFNERNQASKNAQNNSKIPQYNLSQVQNSKNIQQKVNASIVPKQQLRTTNIKLPNQNIQQNNNPIDNSRQQRQSQINSRMFQNDQYDNYQPNNQQYSRQSTFNGYDPRTSMTSNNAGQAYRQSQYNIYNKSNNYPSSYQQPNNSAINPRQSQLINNPNSQSYNVQQVKPQASSFQPNRSSIRAGIPQMTVNCEKCTFTQSVPGNTQIYICCICNQINECFPLYGIFTCGICRANVIYPHGTSRLIKCTKCQTVNRVNPQPSRKVDQIVTIGKEDLQLQDEKIGQNLEQEEKPKNKMSRNEQQDDDIVKQQYQLKTNQNIDQPFKVLSAPKINKKLQQPTVKVNNIPQITEDQAEKRYQSQTKAQFNQQLIQLVHQQKKSHSSQNQDLCKQLLQLSEKLDQSLIISKEKQHYQSQKLPENQTNNYPSILDN